MKRQTVSIMTMMCVVAFVALAIIVRLDLAAGFDRAFLLLFRAANDLADPLGPAWFEEAASDVTSLGGYAILTLFGLFLLFYLSAQDRWNDIRFLAITILSGSLASTGLKMLFSRPRPDLVGQLDRVFTASFPSAHAMMSAVFYLSLAIVILQAKGDRQARIAVAGSAISAIFLIGLSRLYLGVHWPTDVLAGWFAGGAWVGICWLVLARRLYPLGTQ